MYNFLLCYFSVVLQLDMTAIRKSYKSKYGVTLADDLQDKGGKSVGNLLAQIALKSPAGGTGQTGGRGQAAGGGGGGKVKVSSMILGFIQCQREVNDLLFYRRSRQGK